MTIARRVRVSGRVQGVFYRAWTRDEARRLGVTGWVRNCPDGTVEAHVEGDAAAVEQLIERMREGPPAAEVAELTTEKIRPEGFRQFEVALRF